MQPCNCSGTMGLMHKSCLEKWLSQSNSNRCEICNFQFNVQMQPRSFSQWLFRPLTFKDNKNLFNDFVCFLILTPLAVISTWYCVLFAFKFHETENRWEASGLVVLTTFLLFIYVLWFIVSDLIYHNILSII
jgi:E3 ubiquitin-protein ligase MARCH2